MAFTHLDPGSLHKLTRKRIDGKRHYINKNGDIYPSVTTVLYHEPNEGLEYWRNNVVGPEEADRIMKVSGERGTKVHQMCEDYLNNKKPTNYRDPYVQAHFKNIQDELDKIDNISAQEVNLYSDCLKMAGTVDLIGDYEGKRSIVDFKTMRKKKQRSYVKSYFVQETAYSLMWEFLTDERIDQIVTLMTGEDGSKLVFVEDRNDYIQDVYDIRERYDINMWLETL